MLIYSELTFKKLTVGKIYAGLLIAENWRANKTNKTIRMVISINNFVIIIFIIIIIITLINIKVGRGLV